MKDLKFNKHKFLLRILVFIPVALLIAISYTYGYVKHMILFLVYGGEMVLFQENERATITSIYKELKEQHKTK